MLARVKQAVVVALAMVAVLTPTAFAHEITVKGTVAAVEAKRLQVKTGEEKKGQVAASYSIDGKTKIMRDKTAVTFEQAKIRIGEKVVVIVDHESNTVMKALEIRLAAQ
jgi:hypothetical protein